MELADGDPAVIVVGAGHTGLEIAARLKYLGVPHLVIEKKARVGDSVSFHQTHDALLDSQDASGGTVTKLYAYTILSGTIRLRI